MDNLQSLKDFLNSPEGELFLQQFAEEMKKEDEFNKRWTEKTVHLLQSKSNGDLEVLFNSFLAHNKKQSDILWKRGIDGDSVLSNFIFEAFEELGEDYDVEDRMFTAAAYQYRGYIAELIVGQGSFVKVYKSI